MSCKPRCGNSGYVEDGVDVMISQKGNKKFPIPMTLHKQCADCLGADILKDLMEFKEKTLLYIEKALNISKE